MSRVTVSRRRVHTQVGQGLVEYAIILLLVGAVVALAILVWPVPQIRAAIDESGAAEEPGLDEPLPEDEPLPLEEPLPTRDQSPLSGPVLDHLLETGSTVEILDEETTSTNNCNSSTPTEVETQRTRTIEHLVNLEGGAGIEAGVAELVKLSLEGKYGVQDRQSEQRTYTITFVTGPNRWATHTVAWRYTWYEGEAVVRLPDGEEQVVPYRVRARLEPQTTSEEKDCATLP